MTSLPALSDVIRETLTEEIIDAIVAKYDSISELNQDVIEAARALILSALLLPLTEREQGLTTEAAQWKADAETMGDNFKIMRELREAAEARVLALTAENATLQREIDKQNNEGQALVDERRTLIDQVERLTAEREALKAKFKIASDIMQSFTDVFAGESTTDGDLVRRLMRKLNAKIKPLAAALIAPSSGATDAAR